MSDTTRVLSDGTSPRRPPHGPTGVRAVLKAPDAKGGTFCWCDHCGAEGELTGVLGGADESPPTCPHCGHPVGIAVEQQIIVNVLLDPPAAPAEIARALARAQRAAWKLLKHFPGVCVTCAEMPCDCPEGPLPAEAPPDPADSWEALKDRFNRTLYELGMPESNHCQRCGGCGGHPNVSTIRHKE